MDQAGETTGAGLASASGPRPVTRGHEARTVMGPRRTGARKVPGAEVGRPSWSSDHLSLLRPLRPKQRAPPEHRASSTGHGALNKAWTIAGIVPEVVGVAGHRHKGWGSRFGRTPMHACTCGLAAGGGWCACAAPPRNDVRRHASRVTQAGAGSSAGAAARA